MPDDRNDEIRTAFRGLLDTWKKQGQQIATREEQAREKAAREVVEAAVAHTVETIITELAEVQVHFGRSVDALASRLAEETGRLDAMRQAIEIETRRIEELRNIRVAADALDILRQEHDAEVRAFEQERAEKRDTLEQEISETQSAWEREQTAFERTAQEEDALREQERQQAEEEYQYEQARRRKKEMDKYEEKKRELERSLREQEEAKRIDWEEREAAIEARREQLNAYERRLEAFAQEKEEAVQKAREAARRQAREEAETQAGLFEKEVVARRASYEVKIQLLEADVARQADHVEQLSAQLQTAIQQTQGLANRALEGRK